MTKTRTCAECDAPLPAGVPNLFCPACALRGALGMGNAVPLPQPAARTQKGTWSRWFRWLWLRTKEQPGRSEETTLASADHKEKEYLPVTTVAPEPGDVIEDYEILEKIGGNMGLVFKARHRLLDKTVALKLLPADCISDPVRLARFERELRVMGQLEHPNLVTAADARIVAHWHLVAMEWIEGVDLHGLIGTQGPFPVAVACEMARQAALGLQYAHEHSLIHRDIKPSNLMLTRTGTIKVIDMGLALAREDSTAQLTQDGSVLGTMSYCAPEQFRDPSNVNIQADIYSLGCTLYHLLTRKAPYSERKPFPEIMQAHLHEPFPSLTAARPDAPAGLENVLARMTAKDLDVRFSTPREVAEALEPFARCADLKEVVPARTDPSPPMRPPAARVLPTPGARQPVAASAQRPKMRWPLIAALLVTLLAAAGAVFFAISRADRNSGATQGHPVVFLMDTTAPKGVYDLDNAANGGSNAKELYKVLAQDGFLPPASLHAEPLSPGWDHEQNLLSVRPDLVIIHRSSFFHSYNAVYKFGSTNEFAHPTDDPRWLFLYNQIGDDKLISFIGIIGNEVPKTQFLVYSRGTDTNWLSGDFRVEWVNKIGIRFPKLKGRIHTMVIPNYYNGTFRDPKTAEELRSNVIDILKLTRKAR